MDSSTKTTTTSQSSTSFIDGIDLANDLKNKYIIKPLGLFGIAGFIFDTKIEDSVELHSEITDHVVESNSSIQDHIALKPELISLTGYVGELNYTLKSDKFNKKQIVEKLTLISNYANTFTSSVNKARDILTNTSQNNTEKTLNTTSNLYDTYKDLLKGSTKQGNAYQFFKSLWRTRQIMSIDGPWETYTNMVIQDITATQRNSLYTEFVITLKKVEFAQIKTTTFNALTYKNTENQGRAKQQRSIEVDKGKGKGSKTSLLKTGVNSLSKIFG